MTLIEKVLLGAILVGVLIVGKSCYDFQAAGGMKELLVQTGKLVKDVQQEVEAYEPETK